MRVAIALIALLVLALAVLDWLAPDERERRDAALVPLEAGRGDPDAGRRVFETHCIRCHGRDLKGTETGPPLLHPYYRPDHHSDLAIYMAIERGVAQHHWHFGDMPPVPEVSREQSRDVVAYIRRTQVAAGLYEPAAAKR